LRDSGRRARRNDGDEVAAQFQSRQSGKVVTLDLADGRWRAHVGNQRENVAGVGQLRDSRTASIRTNARHYTILSFKDNWRWLEKVGVKVVVPLDPA
jgi:hypothetical protein